MTTRTMTTDEWRAEAARRFGDDAGGWRFTCPACGHVASLRDWREAGAPDGAFAFSCIGRWKSKPRGAFERGEGPCDYAGGGLINLSPVCVRDGDGDAEIFGCETWLFDFAGGES